MQELAAQIKAGKIGVIPTDTLYGLVGNALNRYSVEKIYALKRRRPDKPFIILIGEINDLRNFKIHLDQALIERFKKYWPGPVSLILPCHETEFSFLHRGTNSLAFRLPANRVLIDLLKESGPVVAPSANPEQMPPAETIEEAKKYFGSNLDFYFDGGKLGGIPSKLISLLTKEENVLR